VTGQTASLWRLKGSEGLLGAGPCPEALPPAEAVRPKISLLAVFRPVNRIFTHQPRVCIRLERGREKVEPALENGIISLSTSGVCGIIGAIKEGKLKGGVYA